MTKERDRHPVAGAVLAFLLGVGYLLVSLPGALGSLSRHGWGWLAGPAAFGAWCDGLLPGFDLLVELTLAGLVVFTVAMTLLCLRHGGPRLARRSLVALVLSLVVIHLLSWIGTGVYYVVRFLASLVVDLASLIPHGWFTGVIFWVVVSAIGLVWLSALWIGLRNDWRSTVANVAVGVVRGLLPVLFLLLAPVIRVIEHYVAIVAVALAVLVGIATLGQLLVDQVRSSLLAGRGELGMLMGAMGVGTALAALLVESDEFGNYRLLPTPVAHWAQTWMLGAGPPTLDAMAALLVIALCVVGLAGNIAKMRTPPDFDEFRTSVIYSAVGIVAAGGLAAISASSRLRDIHNHS